MRSGIERPAREEVLRGPPHPGRGRGRDDGGPRKGRDPGQSRSSHPGGDRGGPGAAPEVRIAVQNNVPDEC